MAIPDRDRTCFIIMPFGEKKDVDGRDIDFDDIYRYFFKKTIKDLGIKCIRCDEIDEAGSIHEKMFEHIYQSDIVVVDITTSNPNVFYELGVRHALAKGVTLLIRRRGTTIPFNIQNLNVVEYDPSRFMSVERAKERIRKIVESGLDLRKNDSPVHAVLELNIEPEGKPCAETEFIKYRLKDATDLIVGLVTGDVQNVRKGVDVWVNSENTNMQMARPFENSVSGVIRYLGAREKGDGDVKEDTIADALARAMNGRTAVSPAEVLVTTSGALEETHRVKRIFHVAANIGQAGSGYSPIPNPAQCVVNALSAGRIASKAGEGCDLKSILFPLIGTRQIRGKQLEAQVKPLINAAIDFLQNNREKSPFRKVYFLAYTDKEIEVCQRVFRSDPRLKALSVSPAVPGRSRADRRPAAMNITINAPNGESTGGTLDSPSSPTFSVHADLDSEEDTDSPPPSGPTPKKPKK